MGVLVGCGVGVVCGVGTGVGMVIAFEAGAASARGTTVTQAADKAASSIAINTARNSVAVLKLEVRRLGFKGFSQWVLPQRRRALTISRLINLGAFKAHQCDSGPGSSALQ